MSNQCPSDVPKWQSVIWLGLGLALIALLISMLILVAVTQMRVLAVIQEGVKDRAFAASMLSSSNLILLRLIVVLVGGGISFSGLAVSFFAHEKASVFSAGELPAALLPKFRLASHSPGIIAIIVGAVVIVCSLYATTRTRYEGPSYATDTPAKPDGGGSFKPLPG
ncbi:MAG TPA: hypothetical protein VNQ97_10935 [Burkholderiaceae bacterium]|nr:hypothetical protein [Burkholderiaceae bacterium]